MNCECNVNAFNCECNATWFSIRMFSYDTKPVGSNGAVMFVANKIYTSRPLQESSVPNKLNVLCMTH